MELEYIEASGSWYGIGQVEGQTQRVAVKYTIGRCATYHRGSPGFRALGRVAERVGAFLSERFPEEWAELQGIADGAGVELPLLRGPLRGGRRAGPGAGGAAGGSLLPGGLRAAGQGAG